MGDVLAVLEHRGGEIKRTSHEVLTAARSLADQEGGAAHAVVIGPTNVNTDGLGEFGADRVYAHLDDGLKLYQADTYAQVVAERVKAGGYVAVIIASTAEGRDLGPRVAAKLGCPLAADVTSLKGGEGGGGGGDIVVTRPVYSGKAIYTLKVTAKPCVLAIRPNVFTPVASPRDAAVESVPKGAAGSTAAKTVDIKAPERAALDVAEASMVVSGGRGLKEPENFRLIEELAEALGAAVGASRAVVDAGWRPHAEQVGQTGKTVSPNLYVAVGISGAIQHLAGMRTAKVIVAINRDKDAPIFKIADYGIVGDLFEIVPKLTEEIKKIRGN